MLVEIDGIAICDRSLVLRHCQGLGDIVIHDRVEQLSKTAIQSTTFSFAGPQYSCYFGVQSAYMPFSSVILVAQIKFTGVDMYRRATSNTG